MFLPLVNIVYIGVKDDKLVFGSEVNFSSENTSILEGTGFFKPLKLSVSGLL